MGHLNDHDPANTRAITRSRLGLSRETQRFRTGHYPHPSRGGTRGFPLWLRTVAINDLLQNRSYVRAAHRIECSTSSIRRWERRILPYRMTGGRQREQLTGPDQLLLSICIYIYPAASSDEIAAFIHASGGDIYTRPQISDRCNELELTRNRASKESYDAFSEASLRAYRWFTTLSPPLGIHNIPMHRLIDIDETGFYLKKCSSNYGRGHRTCRVRCPQHYRRNELKINVILAVESGNPNIPHHMDGSINRPRKWLRMTIDNVDQFIFGGFINEILTNIETHPVPGGYDDTKIILWDNLRAHKTPYVTNIIEDRVSHNDFSSCDRPPYCPKIAPIEYIFCELAAELSRRCVRDWTIVDLRRNIIDIIRNIGRDGKLHSTFAHCGYPF